MAGRPRLEALTRRIEELGGEEYVFDRVADGDSMAAIARDLGVSRSYLYRWIYLDRERRTTMLREARAVSAHSKAEDGERILDELTGREVLTNADVSLAQARANYRKWLAGVRNEEYRDRPTVGVELNVGSLHLDALRAVNTKQVGGGRGVLPPAEPDEGRGDP